MNSNVPLNDTDAERAQLELLKQLAIEEEASQQFLEKMARERNHQFLEKMARNNRSDRSEEKAA